MNLNFKSFDSWLLESKEEPTFNEIFRVKNKWVPVGKSDKKVLMDEFKKLIDHAYEPIGGHLKIKDTDDMLRDDWDVWWANDVDEDPDADVVFFGKRTPFGIKLVGVGHDGGRIARRESLLYRGHFLLQKGGYLETSDKPYMILHNKFNVPIIKDPKVVQAVLNKPIRWYGLHPKGKEGDPYGNDAWYSRKIGGKEVLKVLMGNPMIDVLKK